MGGEGEEFPGDQGAWTDRQEGAHSCSPIGQEMPADWDANSFLIEALDIGPAQGSISSYRTPPQDLEEEITSSSSTSQ